MKMNTFFGNTKILSSVEAEAGAKDLMDKIRDKDLTMDILPNQYARFSGELEEQDYISYCHFLESSNGKKVLQMLEEEDARNAIEL